jgi:hypothetical protein
MSKARDIASAAPAPSTVSATELGYLDGVTSAVQTQIDSKIGQSTAINPTIVDAKGDIIAATAADTVARLAVGANDTVLTADSSTATGLKWAAPAAGGMTLLSTTTLSGASVTVSGISTAYTDLAVYIYGITNATGDGRFRIAPNGATNLASYAYMGGGGGVESINAGYILNRGSSAFDNATNAYTLIINNYSSTAARKTFSWMGSHYMSFYGDVRGFDGGGGINTTSAITSLVFSNDSYNLSTGTVLIYGVK